MGTFAEKATVDYRLSFSGKEKQTSRFDLQHNKRKFAVSVCIKQTEVAVFR